MKTRATNRFVIIFALLATSHLRPVPCLAQMLPSLGLQYSAGHPTLTFTGEVGTVYSIQSASGLSQTNQWVDRTLLQVQGASNVWTNPSAPTPGGRRWPTLDFSPVTLPCGHPRAWFSATDPGRWLWNWKAWFP
jgi:hypothetical protein